MTKRRPVRDPSEAAGVEVLAPAVRCPYDGEPLREDAVGLYCERAGGYPYALPNPRYDPRGSEPETLQRHLPQKRKTACPHCRQPLGWDGGCLSCYGAPSGRREEWNFPGMRFDRYNDSGKPYGDGHHWMLMDSDLNRSACSIEDNRDGLRAIKAILGRGPLATR
jgi:hypothetical protein